MQIDAQSPRTNAHKSISRNIATAAVVTSAPIVVGRTSYTQRRANGKNRKINSDQTVERLVLSEAANSRRSIGFNWR